MNLRLLILALVLIAAPMTAYTCGESLYRVGKGVNYREYTAPLPGNLLIYSETVEVAHLADDLRRAGHTVNVATVSDELEAILNGGQVEVVIAPLVEAELLQARLSDASINVLPVVQTKDQARAVKAEYDHVMVADKDELRDYLKAIHRQLKRRG